jgi:hypothetical protein
MPRLDQSPLIAADDTFWAVNGAADGNLTAGD